MMRRIELMGEHHGLYLPVRGLLRLMEHCHGREMADGLCDYLGLQSVRMPPPSMQCHV